MQVSKQEIAWFTDFFSLSGAVHPIQDQRGDRGIRVSEDEGSFYNHNMRLLIFTHEAIYDTLLYEYVRISILR